MAQTIARYAITVGLAGCYMPDSHMGPYQFATRGELAQAIRDEIEFQEFPQSAFAQVGIRKLWAAIQYAGSSSSYHFSIAHKGREIAFHGLTEEEFDAMEKESE